jgi:hypothetical protein
VEGGPIQQLALKAGEKRFGNGVVVAIPDRPHGRLNARLPTVLTKGDARVLAAMVGVVDDAVLWSPVPERHIEGGEHKVGAQVIGHRPAECPEGAHRLKTSRTTARYRKPIQVGTKVISADRSVFGATATN